MGKKKTSRKSTRRETTSFEASLNALEKVVAELESGELGLADALAKYESGVEHLRTCHEMLQQAERRIELLTGVDADGRPLTTEFVEDSPATLAEQGPQRSRKRSAPGGRSQRKASTDPRVDGSDTLF